MLKGYTLPLSPLGKANLVSAPPWHYSGDVIALEFWADPAAANATLPPGLAQDPNSAGHALGLFVDWQFTAQDDEYLDPARYQYREFYVLVDALYKDTPVAWVPYMFVDNDSAMARGHAQGYPKRLGTVFQTRSFAAPSLAAAPLARGTRLGASLSSHGERLAEGRIKLGEPINTPPAALLRPTVNRRYFPRLTAGRHDDPAVNELVMAVTDDLNVVGAWLGDAELKLPEVRGEELHALAPIRMGAGYRFSMSCTINDLRILEDFSTTAQKG
jgi:Acetoacetate decarboxylase (ADC)